MWEKIFRTFNSLLEKCCVIKPFIVKSSDIESFKRDGAIIIRGLFSGFVDQIATGINKNLSTPGPHAADNLAHGEKGQFFDDYCNWQNKF